MVLSEDAAHDAPVGAAEVPRLAAALARHAPHDAGLAAAAAAAGGVPPLLRLVTAAARPPASYVAAAAAGSEGTGRDLAAALGAACALAAVPPGRGPAVAGLPLLAAAARACTGPARAAVLAGVLRLAAVALGGGAAAAAGDAVDGNVDGAAASTVALAVVALRPTARAPVDGGGDAGVAAPAAAALALVVCSPALWAAALRGADAGGCGPMVAALVAAVTAYPHAAAVVQPALAVLCALTGADAVSPQRAPFPPPPGLLLALVGVLESTAPPPDTLVPALSLACAVDVVALLPVAGRPPLIGRGGVVLGAPTPASPTCDGTRPCGAVRGSDALYGDDFDAWLQCILRPCGVDVDAWDLRPVETSARFVNALLRWVRVADVADIPPTVATAACHTVHVVATASTTMRHALLDAGGRNALVGLLSRVAAAEPPPPSSLVEAGLAAIAAVGVARRLFFFTPHGGTGADEGSVGRVLASAVAVVPPSPRLYRLALAAIGSAVVLPPSADATAADASAALAVAVAALASSDDGVVDAALATLAGLVGVTPVADASVADAIGLLLRRPALHPSLAQLASDVLGVVRAADAGGGAGDGGGGGGAGGGAAAGSPPPCSPRVCSPPRGTPRPRRSLRMGGVSRKRVSFGSDSFHDL